MITIELISNGEFLTPQRMLTPEERETITSTLFNGVNVIHYQGDEPAIETKEENGEF